MRCAVPSGVASKLRNYSRARHLTFELAEKSATGKAAMDTAAIFAPARSIPCYALDLIYRKPLTIDAWDGLIFG
jgi:hypothetical protein